MKILVVNYEYPPLGGGAANATYYLLQHYARVEGLSVTLITSSVETGGVEKLAPNVELHFLDIGKQGSLHYQSNSDLLRYSWRALRAAKRLLREESFDLVHAFFGIPCGFIARRLGLPYVVSLRGSDVPGYSERYRIADALLFRRLSRFIWKNGCAVVANSSGLRALAHQTAPEQEIDVIPNGVDTEAFAPLSRSAQGGREAVDGGASPDTAPESSAGRSGGVGAPGTLRLIYVGRLIPRKGLAVLLEALARIDGVALTIVGTGPQEASLKEAAYESDIPVTFRGETPHDELPEIYRAHDAFVLPSRNEGMSNTLLEAMASGLPVVVTDVGGTRELVEDNGFVVAVDDAAGLEAAFCSLRDNPQQSAHMCVRSREIAERYSWKAVAEAYLNHYQACV